MQTTSVATVVRRNVTVPNFGVLPRQTHMSDSLGVTHDCRAAARMASQFAACESIRLHARQCLRSPALDDAIRTLFDDGDRASPDAKLRTVAEAAVEWADTRMFACRKVDVPTVAARVCKTLPVDDAECYDARTYPSRRFRLGRMRASS